MQYSKNNTHFYLSIKTVSEKLVISLSYQITQLYSDGSITPFSTSAILQQFSMTSLHCFLRKEPNLLPVSPFNQPT